MTAAYEALKKQLDASVKVDPVNNNIKLTKYLNISEALALEGKAHADDKRWDLGYVYNKRCAMLCIKVIAAHKDFGSAEFARKKETVKRRGNECLDLAVKCRDELKLSMQMAALKAKPAPAKRKPAPQRTKRRRRRRDVRCPLF